ncbi:F-box domain, Leucine-rich repeat domain, L domain-like protein [Artemisia annua]|uniref:F-box domain, Leucine-rich repeat domain, L domain-like protein n=1 Tax=Artemisia annua TaxID=35608 RepID=A0A2U1LG64_ARTAN|nr:F-box domain, Leucine-rich repeat domain, L domain-like protein [Artemisia annua]
MEDDILIDATDRISQVPEFIIHHIMSFLDSPKKRVRMSVLSKDLFAITASDPILDFDIRKFGEFIPFDPSNNGNFRDKFFKYVEYTTSRFCQQNVSAHTIKLIAEVWDATHVDILDRCLELVLLKGVQVLVVNIKNGVSLLSSSIPRYHVPNQLLSASSLTSFTLRGCEMPSSLMVDPLKFKSLKLLQLEYLHLDEELIKYRTTNCTLLEELLVKFCYGFKRFCVYGLQNLKKVEIVSGVEFDDPLLCDTGVEIIDIEAPNLLDIFVANRKRSEAPCINLASCEKLTTLTYNVFLPSKSGVLSDLLSNETFIQNLTLFLPYNCKRLKLSSSSLRKLVLIEKSTLEEIDISTPNLLLFEYHVNMNLPALVSLVPEAEANFGQEKRFQSFKAANLCGIDFFNVGIPKVIQSPQYELEHVELQLTNIGGLSAIKAIVGAVLLVLLSSISKVNFMFTYEKLLQQEDEGQSNIRFVLSSSKAEKHFSDLNLLLTALPRIGQEHAITFTKEEDVQEKAG